ncbi:MAG: VWA domain-containing protein [Planctomycetia bacterium]|nr:VWA domain-containing protein [Planctomycetia bacterium]
MAPWPLLAEMTTRTTFELGRLQAYTERWHYLVLALVCAAIVAWVAWMYRRDGVELRRGVGLLLLVLRVTALAGLLAFYLHLEKRTERKVVHNSRVLLLVDTSLSMGLHDTTASAVPATPNRLEQVVSVLDEGGLIKQLRQKHDVLLSRFDGEVNRIGSFKKLPVQAGLDEEATFDQKPASSEPAGPKHGAQKIDLKNELLPQGTETRLGQSLRQLINDERSTPVAGVVVFSDGGQNAGIDPSAAIAASRDAKIPIFTVGVGSERRPANVRVSDLVAPARAYPGDGFHITGYLQSEGLADRGVTVDLLSRVAGEAGKTDEGKVEGSERITLGGRGEVVPVKFEITPAEKGRRIYRLRVKAPPEDSNSNDDQQEVDIEIVDRKTKVLLIASGPTREYIFLRNQLRRDKETAVDVWLQSAAPGVSQDANRILEAFPSTPQELFEYDAIVAFDPDWKALDGTEVDLLERWVAEKAGGLILLAGPVETDRWAQDPKMTKIRGLYPVEFNRRLSLMEEGRFGSTVPWPIEFTREGIEAEFLWLSDNGPSSQQIWSSFPGVFGYYGVRGAKPGATVYGRYSDPEAGSGDQRPVYFAGQFYGAGRVFYLGSGEMWRLRALSDSYFEQFYTKLIRHVSQGRLLVGSSRGMLLVDRDRYLLGNTVVVRAQLSTVQFEPLDAPSVTLQVIRPDSTSESLQLAADPARKGMYVGQFTALQEGTYRLEMPLPDGDAEQLTRRIQVKVPDLERENPERNDALLSEIAKRTGGLYYVGADAVLGARGVPPLEKQLSDRTEVTYLAGVTDRDFEHDWMRGLLIATCGALCLEWLIRRLSKLA